MVAKQRQKMGPTECRYSFNRLQTSCLRTRFVGSASSFREAYDALVAAVVLSDSPYRIGRSPTVEIYLKDASITGPDALEVELLTKVYDEQRKMFAAAAGQDPSRFIQLGDTKPDEFLAPVDLAALAVTCQVILNLDATIFER